MHAATASRLSLPTEPRWCVYLPHTLSLSLKLSPFSHHHLNQTDECAPPHTRAEGTHSVCLRYTCQYANATSAERCINDNTVYTTYVSQSQKYGTIISQ